jgi:error-prone DNA polymerase
MSFIELHAQSAFSFLEAAEQPETLAREAARLEMPALALVDRDGVYGAPRFYREMTRLGLRALVGSEITLVDGSRLSLLVEEREGYQNLCRLITRIKLREIGADNDGPEASADDGENGARGDSAAEHELGGRGRASATSPRPRRADGERVPARLRSSSPSRERTRRGDEGRGSDAAGADLGDLEEHAAGLVCLTGTAEAHLDRLVGIFGRSSCFVEIQRHLNREQERRTQRLIALADRHRLPLVATNQPVYCRPGGHAVADVLTCIREHTDLDHAGRRLARNAERRLKPGRVMERLFADRPDAIVNTGELATRLNFTLKNLGYRFPDYPLPPGETPIAYLRTLCEQGARERYGRGPLAARARKQIARELDLIGRLDLPGYFLIVWEIVQYCRANGILVQGRGSAANSAVCYTLGITAVDPVGMDLLFERFLSEARGEWPDIDLDLPSGDRREQVIQHVYRQYGAHSAGMTANVITYRGRLAAREVGKALGLPPDLRDRLSKLVSNWGYQDPEELLIKHLGEAGCDPRHPRIRKFAALWVLIQDLPRHLGQHSGGMVLAGGRLDEVVPLEPATMPGRVVVQWDKDDCAALGIVKIDLLGLGMMAVLQDAIGLVREQGGEFDLAKLPADDPAVYAALQKADTVGLFQVESRAQMATLPRIHPERFYDLVVQVAIIRPGPIVGNMVHPYINRRRGREPVTYPHPSLEPILRRTLGVPLFQEQLLRMAMVAAGFSGSEAEELRRAFGFKRSEQRMVEVEAKLRGGMAEKGITGRAAEEIVHSITSFALYGFPESHASSFALLAYASAYLRTHHPAAFYAAILNNQPMGFYHPATLVKDAQRHGLRILPIDVTVSDWACTIEPVPGVEPSAGDGNRVASRSARSTGRPEEGTASAREVRRPIVMATGAGKPRQGGQSRRQPHSEAGSNPGPETGEPSGRPLLGVRLGLRYVAGLRESAGKAIVAERRRRPFRDADDLVRRCHLETDEVETLAQIGALAAFGLTRRAALWEGARVVRPAGRLFEADVDPGPDPRSPLREMTREERVVADYAGTGITIGPHPMALRRAELARLGVVRATDLPGVPHGHPVRVAGSVIVRQRPGTAKGFVFLSLEDETGIANVIVRPWLFTRCRVVLISEPFLLIEGILQQQDNVVSVRAEQVEPLAALPCHVPSHDFG